MCGLDVTTINFRKSSRVAIVRTDAVSSDKDRVVDGPLGPGASTIIPARSWIDIRTKVKLLLGGGLGLSVGASEENVAGIGKIEVCLTPVITGNYK